MKILFKEQKTYNGVTYEAGKTYEITSDRGMAKRWLDRGCVEGKGEALADPAEPKQEVKKEEKPAPVKKEDKKPLLGKKVVAKVADIGDTSIDL